VPNEDGLQRNKFEVRRTDGKDQPGGPKEGARYFVLDYANDSYARDALMEYIGACNLEFPQLANDLINELRTTAEHAEMKLLRGTSDSQID
jgi:hypothetical protein